MSCKQHHQACKSCPFSRTCEPGALGGSPLNTYLGQIVGPFHLPCHSAGNYKGNDTPCTNEHAQCSGAAIFRRNIGVDVLMPDPLLKLQTEDENVFSSLEEFITHHAPYASAQTVADLLHMTKNGFFLSLEMSKAAAKGRVQTGKDAVQQFDQQGGNQ